MHIVSITPDYTFKALGFTVLCELTPTFLESSADVFYVLRQHFTAGLI